MVKGILGMEYELYNYTFKPILTFSQNWVTLLSIRSGTPRVNKNTKRSQFLGPFEWFSVDKYVMLLFKQIGDTET
jgi:hypothetical protein